MTIEETKERKSLEPLAMHLQASGRVLLSVYFSLARSAQ